MASGDQWQGHGLPKVLPVPAMPYCPTLYTLRAATPEMAVSWVATPETGGLKPSSTPLDTPPRTPLEKNSISSLNSPSKA
jgi:hypothetical protein